MTIPQHVLQLPDDLKGLMAAAKHRQTLPSPLFDVEQVPFHLRQDTLFVFWGDWHLGAEGTDYDEFEQDLAALTVAKYMLGDQLQVVAMGDYIDGYLPSGTPKNPTQLLSPREQRLSATRALEAIDPLLVIAGDHDEWHSKQSVEHDWLFEVASTNGFNFAQWGSEVRVILPRTQEDLTILARHRFKGSRGTDVLRPHKNAHMELGPADVVVLAHVHSNPGCYRTYSKRRKEGSFLAIQSGTYKIRDDYAKKLGGYVGEYGVPAVLIQPDGQLRSFDSYRDGLELIL